MCRGVRCTSSPPRRRRCRATQSAALCDFGQQQSSSSDAMSDRAGYVPARRLESCFEGSKVHASLPTMGLFSSTPPPPPPPPSMQALMESARYATTTPSSSSSSAVYSSFDVLRRPATSPSYSVFVTGKAPHRHRESARIHLNGHCKIHALLPAEAAAVRRRDARQGRAQPELCQLAHADHLALRRAARVLFLHRERGRPCAPAHPSAAAREPRVPHPPNGRRRQLALLTEDPQPDARL